VLSNSLETGPTGTDITLANSDDVGGSALTPQIVTGTATYEVPGPGAEPSSNFAGRLLVTTGGGRSSLYWDVGGPWDTHYTRFNFRAETLASTPTWTLRWLTANGTTPAWIGIDPATRKIQVYDTSIVLRGTSTTALTLSSWYRIEAKIFRGNPNGIVTVRIYSSVSDLTPIEELTVSNVNLGNLDISRVIFGLATTQNIDTEVWVDDLASDNRNWIGRVPVNTAKTLNYGVTAASTLVNNKLVSRVFEYTVPVTQTTVPLFYAYHMYFGRTVHTVRAGVYRSWHKRSIQLTSITPSIVYYTLELNYTVAATVEESLGLGNGAKREIVHILNPTASLSILFVKDIVTDHKNYVIPVSNVLETTRSYSYAIDTAYTTARGVSKSDFVVYAVPTSLTRVRAIDKAFNYSVVAAVTTRTPTITKLFGYSIATAQTKNVSLAKLHVYSIAISYSGTSNMTKSYSYEVVAGNRQLITGDTSTAEGGTIGTWNSSATATVSVSSTSPHTGTKCHLMTALSNDVISVNSYTMYGSPYVLPSHTYTLGGYFRPTGFDRTCYVNIAWYTASETFISAPYFQAVCPADVYTLVAVPLIAPSNAAKFTVTVGVIDAVIGDVVRFDDVTFVDQLVNKNISIYRSHNITAASASSMVALHNKVSTYSVVSAVVKAATNVSKQTNHVIPVASTGVIDLTKQYDYVISTTLVRTSIAGLPRMYSILATPELTHVVSNFRNYAIATATVLSRNSGKLDSYSIAVATLLLSGVSIPLSLTYSCVVTQDYTANTTTSKSYTAICSLDTTSSINLSKSMSIATTNSRKMAISSNLTYLVSVNLSASRIANSTFAYTTVAVQSRKHDVVKSCAYLCLGSLTRYSNANKLNNMTIAVANTIIANTIYVSALAYAIAVIQTNTKDVTNRHAYIVLSAQVLVRVAACISDCTVSTESGLFINANSAHAYSIESAQLLSRQGARASVYTISATEAVDINSNVSHYVVCTVANTCNKNSSLTLAYLTASSLLFTANHITVLGITYSITASGTVTKYTAKVRDYSIAVNEVIFKNAISNHNQGINIVQLLTAYYLYARTCNYVITAANNIVSKTANSNRNNTVIVYSSKLVAISITNDYTAAVMNNITTLLSAKYELNYVSNILSSHTNNATHRLSYSTNIASAHVLSVNKYSSYTTVLLISLRKSMDSIFNYLASVSYSVIINTTTSTVLGYTVLVENIHEASVNSNLFYACGTTYEFDIDVLQGHEYSVQAQSDSSIDVRPILSYLSEISSAYNTNVNKVNLCTASVSVVRNLEPGVAYLYTTTVSVDIKYNNVAVLQYIVSTTVTCIPVLVPYTTEFVPQVIIFT
jgi:hypothetical protein